MTTRVAFEDIINQQRNKDQPSKRDNSLPIINRHELRQKNSKIQGKENVVVNIIDNPQLKPVHQVKNAGRKLTKSVIDNDEQMKVEEDVNVLQDDRQFLKLF